MQNGSRVISGAVTSVFGGVTLLWDVYQLKDGVKELAAGEVLVAEILFESILCISVETPLVAQKILMNMISLQFCQITFIALGIN